MWRSSVPARWWHHVLSTAVAANRTVAANMNVLAYWRSQVFEEEQHDIKTKFEQTHGAGSDAIPFTLAFSGGGVRAAAFQAC
eukprot:3636446-Amphidinium_carterae.1